MTAKVPNILLALVHLSLERRALVLVRQHGLEPLLRVEHDQSQPPTAAPKEGRWPLMRLPAREPTDPVRATEQERRKPRSLQDSLANLAAHAQTERVRRRSAAVGKIGQGLAPFSSAKRKNKISVDKCEEGTCRSTCATPAIYWYTVCE